MPNSPPVPGPAKDGAAAALLTAENERLHERIRQLEQAREADRKTIAALQAEREAYRRAVYAWALEQITDEDLQRYAQKEDGLPLDDLIGEVEAGTRAGRDA